MTDNPPEAQVFDLAPVPMWMEDYSGIRTLFDQWRAEGVEDIRRFLREDLSRADECSSRIKVLKVNRKTLELYEASDHGHLVENLSSIFRDEMLENLVEELAQLWEGNNEFSSSA